MRRAIVFSLLVCGGGVTVATACAPGEGEAPGGWAGGNAEASVDRDGAAVYDAGLASQFDTSTPQAVVADASSAPQVPPSLPYCATQDAGAGADAGAPSCNALDPCAAQVVGQTSVHGPPPPLGGPIVAGAYALFDVRFFDGATDGDGGIRPGEVCGPGVWFCSKPEVLELGDSAYARAAVDPDSSSAKPTRSSGTYAVDGTTLVFDTTCPTSGAETWSYAATGNELFRFLAYQPTGLTWALVYRRQ